MVNKAILIGNLGGDVELKFTQGGAAVANFNLATTETWVKDGKKEEAVEWHKIVCFGRLAEICGEYLSKGSKIYLEGRITTRTWTDKDDNKRYTTEIVGREMKMLSPRNSDGQRNEPEPGPQMGDDSVPF